MKFWHFYDPALVFSFHSSRLFPLSPARQPHKWLTWINTNTRRQSKSIVCLSQRSYTNSLTVWLRPSQMCSAPDTPRNSWKRKKKKRSRHITTWSQICVQGPWARATGSDCLSPHTDPITKACPKSDSIKHYLTKIVNLRRATTSAESKCRNARELKLWGKRWGVYRGPKPCCGEDQCGELHHGKKGRQIKCPKNSFFWDMVTRSPASLLEMKHHCSPKSGTFWNAEAGRPLRVWDQPGPHNEFWPGLQRPCQKNKTKQRRNFLAWDPRNFLGHSYVPRVQAYLKSGLRRCPAGKRVAKQARESEIGFPRTRVNKCPVGQTAYL